MTQTLGFSLTAALFLLNVKLNHAQESVTIQTLGERYAQKQWEVTIPVQLEHLTFNLAILRDGIATYSREKRALLAYGFDGDLKWEKVTSEYPGAQIYGSPDGVHLVVCYHIGEEVPANVVYDYLGKALRQSDFCTPSFSKDGKYIIGGGLKPMVLNTESGKILWSKLEEQKYRNWNPVSTRNDKLVVYTAGLLEQFDLPSGERIWQREVTFEHDGGATTWLKVSPDGNLIVLQFFVFGKIHQKNIVFVYDAAGNLLYQHERPVEAGKTNGGIIQAISEDNKYLAISDLQEFRMCTTKGFELVWTIPGKTVPREVQYFGKNLMVFRANFEWKKTRVLALNETGQIVKDCSFELVLDFQTAAHFPEFAGYRNIREDHGKSMWDDSVIPVMQIDECSEGVRFSLFRLSADLMLKQ